MKSRYLSFIVSSILAVAACTQQIEEEPDKGIEFPTDEIPELNIGKEGGNYKLSFYAHDNWTARVSVTRSDDWLAVSPENGEKGDSQISIQVDENGTYDEREGSVTIECGTQSTEIKIRQSLLNDIIVDQNEYKVGNGEETIYIDYRTNVECDVLIDDDCDWLTRVESKGLRDERIGIKVSENPENTDRTGKIVLKYKSISRTIYITQSALYDVIDFKDPKFKEYICENFDTDENGIMQRFEVEEITSIDCSEREISYIDEISNFKSLKKLICKNNNIKNVDISSPNLTNLKEFSFKGCDSLRRIWVHNSTKYKDREFEWPSTARICILVSDNYFEVPKKGAKFTVTLRSSLDNLDILPKNQQDTIAHITRESDTTYTISISESKKTRKDTLMVHGNEEDHYCTEHIVIIQKDKYKHLESETRISRKNGIWSVYALEEEEGEEEEPTPMTFEYKWEVSDISECATCIEHNYKLDHYHGPTSHMIDIRGGVTLNGEACPWKIEYVNENDREWIKIQESGSGIGMLHAELNGNPSTESRTARFNLIALNENGNKIDSKNLLEVIQDGVSVEFIMTGNTDKFQIGENYISSTPLILHTPYPSVESFYVKSNADDIKLTQRVYEDDGFLIEDALPELSTVYNNREERWICDIKYNSNRHVNYENPYDEPWRGAIVTAAPVIKVHDWSDNEQNKGTKEVICKNRFNAEVKDSLMTIQFGVDIFAQDYAYIAGPIANQSKIEHYNKAYRYDNKLSYVDDYLIMYSNVDCKLCSADMNHASWDYDLMYDMPGEVKADGYYYSYYAGEIWVRDMLDNWQKESKYDNREIIRNKEVQNGKVEWLYAEAYLHDDQEPLKVPFTLLAQYGIPAFYIQKWEPLNIDTFVGHYDFDLGYMMTLEILNPTDNFSEQFIKGNTYEYTYYTNPYEHPGADAYESWTPTGGSKIIVTSMFGYWGDNYVYNDIRMMYPNGAYIYAVQPAEGSVYVPYQGETNTPSISSPAIQDKINTSSVDLKENLVKFTKKKSIEERLRKR